MRYIIIFSSIFIFYLLTIRSGHSWDGDFAMYVQHAKNICNGNDYAYSKYIINKNNITLGPKKYPPVFPVMLTPLYCLFKFNWYPYKIFISFLLILSGVLLFLIARNYLPEFHSIIVSVIFLLNPLIWDYKDQILSDVPFLLLLFISILVIQKWKNSFLYLILIGFLLFLVLNTRSVGIAFIVSYIMHILLNVKEKKKKLYSILIPLSVIVIFSILIKLFLGGGESDYFSMLKSKLSAPSKHLRAMYYTSTHFFKYSSNVWKELDFLSSKLTLLLHFILIIFSGIGFFKIIREKGLSLIELFVLLYASLIIFWGSAISRYVLPLIPFMFIYLLYGTNNKYLLYGILLYSFLFVADVIFFMDVLKFPASIEDSESVEMFNFVKENTDTNSIILFRRPRIMALLTNRYSVVYTYTNNKEEHIKLISNIGVDYIIYTKPRYGKLAEAPDSLYIKKFIENYSFPLLFENNSFSVYKVVR